MLKANLIRPRLLIRGDQVLPRALAADYYWLGVGQALMALFAAHNGRSRGELTAALRDYEGDSLDYPIIRGLAAVLEGRCTFGNDPPVKPADLRHTLFGRGPVTTVTDLFSQASRTDLIAEAAARYDVSAGQIEQALFADLVEEQILLKTGDPLTPAELIGRYNLEVARGLLYWAKEVRIQVEDNYKDVFKFIKLFKLMHTIQPRGEGGYAITLHGPISPFVKSTIRYGLQFAKFMPALLLCHHWQMEADVRPSGSDRFRHYKLDDRTPLRTHFKPSGEFDSQLEADFAAEFEQKYGRAKRTWEMAREDEIISLGDTVMIPDFSFTHKKDGRRALLEIVGFWHPDYLRRKLKKVRQANRDDLILLVYESANVAEAVWQTAGHGEVLFFKNKPVLKDVVTAVERCAQNQISSRG